MAVTLSLTSPNRTVSGTVSNANAVRLVDALRGLFPPTGPDGEPVTITDERLVMDWIRRQAREVVQAWERRQAAAGLPSGDVVELAP